MTILRRPSSTSVITREERPAKRARFADDVPPPTSRSVEESSEHPKFSPSSLHRPHPLLLKPSGNAFLNPARASKCRSGGLGTLARLPDALLLELLSHLPAPTLFRLQAVSRALFAFSRHPALWKTLYILESEGLLERWDGDWRRTYFAAFLASTDVVTKLYADAGDEEMAEELVLPADGITAANLCSDVLYQPHLCAAPLVHYFRASGALENVARADGRTMNMGEFAQQFAQTSTPVFLDGLMDGWAATQPHVGSDMSQPAWALPTLAERFPETPFRAEAVRAPLPIYARYCANTCDEGTLYLFDSEFVHRSGGGMEGEFAVPELFGEDLFRVMGSERPDHRWLIAGPARGGSSWHKDPNATSAWNAVITGSKGWIFFPPEIVPPGIFVSEDEAEVTAPLSLAEWFASYYEPALAEYGPRARDPAKRGRMLQGICGPGQTAYVPAGWWHLVVNLDGPCVALTQNFVSETELPSVLKFLRDRPNQVSGFKLRATSAGSAREEDEDKVNGLVYERFVAALERDEPEILRRAREILDREGANATCREGGRTVGMWEGLKAGDESGTFNFDFCEGGEEMDDVPW